jgi:hypothetical protein
MTTLEHLWTCLGEEGSEISQVVSKINRFGQHDRNVLNPTGPTNTERLIQELNDLLAVADLLVAHGVLPDNWQSAELKGAKKLKVIRFMDYARTRGTLTFPESESEVPEPMRMAQALLKDGELQRVPAYLVGQLKERLENFNRQKNEWKPLINANQR